MARTTASARCTWRVVGGDQDPGPVATHAGGAHAQVAQPERHVAVVGAGRGSRRGSGPTPRAARRRAGSGSSSGCCRARQATKCPGSSGSALMRAGRHVEQVPLVDGAERRAPRAVRRGVEQDDLERRTAAAGGPGEVERGQAAGRTGADHDDARCRRCLAHGSSSCSARLSISRPIYSTLTLRSQLLAALGGSPTVTEWSTSRSRAASPSAASWCCASGVPETDGPTVLELRANGVFVMDTAEHASERRPGRRRPRPGRAAPAGAGRRARASASPSTGCSATAGSSGATWSRSSRPWSSGCATAPSPTAASCSPTTGPGSSSRTSRPRSPRPRPRRTTWCCSTSTTAPATWSTRPTRRSTASRSWQRCASGSTPGGVVVVWSAAREPELEDDLRLVFGEAEEQQPRRPAPGPRRPVLALRRTPRSGRVASEA